MKFIKCVFPPYVLFKFVYYIHWMYPLPFNFWTEVSRDNLGSLYYQSNAFGAKDIYTVVPVYGNSSQSNVEFEWERDLLKIDTDYFSERILDSVGKFTLQL